MNSTDEQNDEENESKNTDDQAEHQVNLEKFRIVAKCANNSKNCTVKKEIEN